MKLHFVENMDQVLHIALESDIIALPMPVDVATQPVEETRAH